MVTFVWAERDTRSWASGLALASAAAAGALAVFGLPPVSIHGALHFVGVMDPLCGMTRGVAALARGDASAAIHFNPASLLFALAVMLVLVRGAFGVATGRWLDVRVRPTRLTLALAVAVIAALEVRQQLHAPLLAG